MLRGLLCGLVLAVGCRPAPIPASSAAASLAPSTPAQKTFQQCVCETAQAEVGQQEATGNNDGPRINEYQASTGAGNGTKYCSSGVHWTFRQCGTVIQPAREFAMAQKWFLDPSKVIWRQSQYDPDRTEPVSKPADLGSLYYASLGRRGHVFIIKQENDDGTVRTIEFNTNAQGSRDGGGVWNRTREIEAIHDIARWR